jgi:hypothetical protein
MSQNLITILIKKPTKKGNNYYFNIPIEFINKGKIKQVESYELHIFSIPEQKSLSQNLITILIKKPVKKGNNYYFNISIEFINKGKIKHVESYELHIFSIPEQK